VHAEGDEAAVAALLTWLHRGPTFARVTGVEVADADPTGATTFTVA
jgi:acylphosphatase